MIEEPLPSEESEEEPESLPAFQFSLGSLMAIKLGFSLLLAFPVLGYLLVLWLGVAPAIVAVFILVQLPIFWLLQRMKYLPDFEKDASRSDR